MFCKSGQTPGSSIPQPYNYKLQLFLFTRRAKPILLLLQIACIRKRGACIGRGMTPFVKMHITIAGSAGWLSIISIHWFYDSTIRAPGRFIINTRFKKTKSEALHHLFSIISAGAGRLYKISHSKIGCL